MIPSLKLNQTSFNTDVINILNKFHKNIKFTYVEHNVKVSFLEVLLVRNGKLETTIFHNIY